MTLFDRVADLPVTIEGYELAAIERETSSGFVRTTTEIRLAGDGMVGTGEDVTYEVEDHHAFVDARPPLPGRGVETFDAFSRALGDADLFHGRTPGRPDFRAYRRWAFESAALDLALKQAGTNLGEVLDRAYDPVRFIVSTRLDEPPTAARVRNWLEIDPSLEFKLDPTDAWTGSLVDALAATDTVRTLDLKGQYAGTTVDQSPDADLYRMVLEGFPDAVVEDPGLTEETRPLVAEAVDRLSWDAPIHGVEDVEDLPWEPAWLNIKPSRFGSVRSLFETLEYCRARDIRMYGGGQFELGVGRSHIQALASLFYPDAPNDVAPRAYNAPSPRAGLPSSPLKPAGEPRGLDWPFRS